MTGLALSDPVRTLQARPGPLELESQKPKNQKSIFRKLFQFRNRYWRAPGFKSVKLRHPRETGQSKRRKESRRTNNKYNHYANPKANIGREKTGLDKSGLAKTIPTWPGPLASEFQRFKNSNFGNFFGFPTCPGGPGFKSVQLRPQRETGSRETMERESMRK